MALPDQGVCTCITDPEAFGFGEDPECPQHGYETVIARLEDENERLREGLQSLARPWELRGCLDADAWMRLAQITARKTLEPEYVADGSWSWDGTGPIRPGEPGTPVPGSMAAAIADPLSRN